MNYLDSITKQSPWLLDAQQIEADIHLIRMQSFPLIYHEHTFLEHKFVDGVYMVTGPRQIGKSTLLKMFIKKHLTPNNHENFLYFNCDLLDNKQAIVEMVETYLEQFPSKKRRYLFLDEITAVKDSILAIKYLVDSGHDKNLTYVLTGSSSVNIKKTGEHLPGRRGKGIDFDYKPISFRSYLQLVYPDIDFDIPFNAPEKDFMAIKKTVNLSKALKTYLMTGGFPRVINEYYMNKAINDDVFTIYRSWITSEIAKADKREYIAKRILERCLFSLTSDVSYNAFAQDTGVGSHNTIYDYLNFFENAFVLSLIYNYDIHQQRVNYKKNKKIYFNDPFIYAVIDAWITGKPRQDYDYLTKNSSCSKIIENLIYNHLSYYFENIYFYRAQNEIDFIANNYCIEVKYQNSISTSDYNQLNKLKNNKIVITKQHYHKNKDILLLPVEYFLLCVDKL